jgi:hypothetical protein
MLRGHKMRRAAAGVVGAVTPGDLASTFFWSDPIQETAYSDGDDVTTKTDFSVNSNNFDGTGHASTYETNEIKDLPVFRFDGSAYDIGASKAPWRFLHDGSDFTVFNVIKTASANPNVLMGLFATALSSSEVGFAAAYDDRSSISANDRLVVVLLKGVSGQPIIQLITGNGVAPAQSVIIVEADYVFPRAGNDMESLVEGNLVGSAETINTPHNSGDSTFFPTIGAVSGGTTFRFIGDMGDTIVLKNGTLDDKTFIRNYLANKWV